MVLVAWHVLHAAGAGAEPTDAHILIEKGTVIVGTDPARLKERLEGSRAKVEWYADETPQKKVDVDAFLIDATEVTNEAYKRLVTDHTHPPNLANHPVVNVPWEKASEYCANVGGRLPTEAEWERAARGGDGRVYPWGDSFDPSRAVFAGSGGSDARLRVGSYDLEESLSTQLGGTSPVASRDKGRSPFGLYDMAGNVWEWVDGWYDEKRKLRILKGGSWLSPKLSVRISARLGDRGDVTFNDYGFRCAYDPDR